MPLLVLLVIFVVVPIVEIYVIIQVGQAIGPWWTIALLIADSVAGTVLMKSQGQAAWRRFQLALSEGRIPAREVMDGVLVIFGGAFLLTPGFVTDILGALLLLPPTRAVIRRLVARRFTLTVLGGMPGAMGPRNVRRRPGDEYDVDGTAHDIEPDPRRLS